MKEPSYLFDTNILSALLFPKKGREKIMHWIKENPGRYTSSAIVIYEIESGLWMHKYKDLIKTFRDLVDLLNLEVFDVTIEIAQDAATLRGQASTEGRQYSIEDLLIGFTAIRHNQTLLTANVKDFTSWLPDLINPLD